MALITRLALCLGIGSASLALAATPTGRFALQPLRVDLSSHVPRMLELVNSTMLPEQPMYPGLGSSMGIDLDVLKSLKDQWLKDFDWDKEQEDMNR